MAEMIIRPTMKFVYLRYAAAFLLVVGIAALTMRMEWPAWIAFMSTVLLLWPAKCHIQNRLTTMTILDDKLRYESGFLGKTTRTILISRVQDLTVHQGLGQRIFGVGNLSIETAGETSRLTIAGIDRPQAIADHINELSARVSSRTGLSR
jgi:uncharacterized membrane protein YdbT with pleckstrin-like domain